VTSEPISSAANVCVEPVRFRALDGCPLGGTLYRPDSAAATTDAAVFATGIGARAHVYRWFLTYLASAGLPVLALDYRGIGYSRPAKLRGFEAGFEDWAEYDAGAAIEFMRGRYPDSKLAGIGHSLGAVLVGTSQTARYLSQVVCIGPHTGYFGDHAAWLHWSMRYGWRSIVRLVTPSLGYFPGALFGGEDLPMRIALQWSACSVPGFDSGLAYGDIERGHRLLDQGAMLRVPTLVLSFSDDPWATERGVRRFLHGFRNLLAVRRIVAPPDVGRKRIGHWGFFRRSMRNRLWPLVPNFLLPGRTALRKLP
jgi:predicted alpha/beta hydrolase